GHALANLPATDQLKRAVNDARAVGAVLRDLGFTAEVAENVGRLGSIRAWQKLLNRLQPGDTAALFFASHGVEARAQLPASARWPQGGGSHLPNRIRGGRAQTWRGCAVFVWLCAATPSRCRPTSGCASEDSFARG